MIKTILLLAALLTNTAFAWETKISCDNGQMIVEKQCFSGPSQYGSPGCYSSTTQLVIKNQDIKNFFVSQRAYGYYQHDRGVRSYGIDMVVNIDGRYENGVSGRYAFILNIPYNDSAAMISYYIDIDGSDVTVKAVAHKGSIYGIVPEGDLASWTFHNCYVNL